MFVVTGAPRSATGYASLLLSAADIPTTHERLFRPRASLNEVLDWYTPGESRGESSWLAWAFLELLPQPVPVLHTVRNPWLVIDSLAFRNDILPKEAKRSKGKREFAAAVQRYCPRAFQYDNAVDRAAVMCVEWNARIEQAVERRGCPYRRYHADEMDAAMLASLIEWLGIERSETQVQRAIENTPQNVNGGRHIDYAVEVTNPLVRAHLLERFPDRPPVIDRVMSKAHRRSEVEIEGMLSPELVGEVRSLAERYGYTTGVTQDESCNQCASV